MSPYVPAQTSNSKRFACDSPLPGDDARLRELQALPMPGNFSLSLRVEPDHRLAAGIQGDRHDTVVIRDREDGQVVAAGSRAVRPLWINGEVQRVGYLGGLRKLPSANLPRGVIAETFDRLLSQRRAGEAAFDLTSIMRDNHTARRALERGVRGMPTYKPVGEVVTYTLPTRDPKKSFHHCLGWLGQSLRCPGRVRNKREMLLVPGLRQASAPATPCCETASTIQGALQGYGSNQYPRDVLTNQLQDDGHMWNARPLWDEGTLSSPALCRGLSHDHFRVIEGSDGALACGAVWDQRGFKQAVLHEVSPALRRWRGGINLSLRVLGRLPLPAVGETVSMVYASHLVLPTDDMALSQKLIAMLRQAAHERGADALVLGLPAGHALGASRLFRRAAWKQSSVIYAVHRGEAAAEVLALKRRTLWPEVAVL